ncbi:MAG: hypothetical protein LQ352_007964 [Teloschistes flavicans]|nr:MAG: hypothetical protein LQ352_007964 [Teloschistes flavicans]
MDFSLVYISLQDFMSFFSILYPTTSTVLYKFHKIFATSTRNFNIPGILDKMASNTAIPYERRHADPDGDIEFILDPNGTPSTLRVSGKVLSISSPVFKALIRPHFQEGQALTATFLLGLPSLQNHTSGSWNTSQATQPIKIPLPDDNVDAMTWLCHALHLRNFLNQEPDIALLGQIAVLCKKYQCAQAIVPWTSVWLKKWNESRDDPEQHRTKDHFRMLCIANALDDDAQFFKTCQDICRYSVDEDHPSSEKMSDPDELGFRMLPGGLVGKYNLLAYSMAMLTLHYIECLRARRDRAISMITDIIEGAIDPFINPNLTEREASYKGRSCRLEATSHECQREIHVSHYVTELAHIGLWPLSRLHLLGMGQIYNALRQYRAFEGTMTYQYRENLPDCRCAFYSIDSLIQHQAVNTARFLLEARFCMAQARAGRFKVHEHANCDLQHGSWVRHNHED